MDSIEALRRARDEFESRLVQVSADQWLLPTPCSEWTVSDLVNHMLLATRMGFQLLTGVSREEVLAGLDDDLLRAADDPIDAFSDLAEQMHEAFAAAGGLEGTVPHPMGDIPKTQFIDFRIGDYATHAWDLARAIGAEEQLDDGVVQRVWDDLQPMVPMLSQSGMFGDGPSGNVPDDAELQTRYLDLVGRRP